MSVYYPCEQDRDRLLAHARLLLQENNNNNSISEEATGSNTSPTPCTLQFTESDLTRLSTTCDTILSAVSRMTRYFTFDPEPEDLHTTTTTTTDTNVVAGRVIHAESNTTTASSEVVAGSVVTASTQNESAEHTNSTVPHPFLCSGSVAELLLPRHGRPALHYYTAHAQDMKALQEELRTCKASLRHINAGHGFIWTANVSALQEYAAAYERRRRQRLPHAERAHMRAAKQEENSNSVSNELEASTTTSYESGKSVSIVMPQLNIETRRSNASSSAGANTVTPRVSGCPAGSQMLLTLPSAKLPSANVRESYAVFVQACDSFLEWLDAGLALTSHADDVPQAGTYTLPASTQPSTATNIVQPTRTVRVRRYEVHDVRQLYESMAQQAHGLTATRSYTEYDARLRRRYLQCGSLYAVRDVIRELSAMIDQLEQVAARRLPASVLTIPDLAPYDSYAARTMAAQAASVRTMADFNSVTRSSTAATAALHSSSASSNARDEESATIVFRPPLSAFRALRATLRVTLSVSLSESERSAWLAFQHEYDAVLSNAREVTRLLQDMPRPTLVQYTTNNESEQRDVSGAERSNITSRPRAPPIAVVDNQTATTNTINVSTEQAAMPVTRELNESRENSTSDRRMSESLMSGTVRWLPTPEERTVLYQRFEAYWALRERSKEMKDGLERDIKQKDKTHKTRVAAQAVHDERDAFALKAEKWVKQLSLRRAAESNSESSGNVLWRTARASLQALTSLLTCRAELPSTMTTATVPITGEDESINSSMPGWGGRAEKDEDGLALSFHSPLFAEKQRLLSEVKQLWRVVELQGTQLEHSYPDLFHRSEKHRWMRQLDEFMRRANAITVVFD